MYEPLKDETKEQYLKIWSHYAIEHLNQEALAKLFNCSSDTIANAITWCSKNRTQFSTSILTEAAKESLESRVRELRNDLTRIKESIPINWNAVIGINRLIKENEELLWQFQAVLQHKSFINNTPVTGNFDYFTMSEIEKRIEERKAREIVDTWTDEEKQRYLTLVEAMQPDKEVKIEKNGQTTTIQIKNIAEGKKDEGQDTSSPP